MGKRANETDEEHLARKARKKAKKEKNLSDQGEKKKEKKEKKEKKQKKEKKEKKNKKDKKESPEIPAPATTDSDKNSAAEDQLVSWESFSDAPFEAPIQTALSNAGFEKPSPIQAKAWPVAISGKDVIAVAKTGSGKTLGFLLPIFHRISTKNLPKGAKENVKAHKSSSTPSPMALVVSPTRELAIQIHGECFKFGAPIGITSTCLYGGTQASVQIQELRKMAPQIVIATPGRLCDLLDRKPACLTLKACHFVVLDEADRMLDMGFGTLNQ